MHTVELLQEALEAARRLDTRPYDARIGRHRLLAHARTHYAHWPLVGRALDVLKTRC